MKIVKPPATLQNFGNTTIFLGGSIEMGKAQDWQNDIIESCHGLPITFWNPRRDDWDSSWKQDPTPGTNFHGQVTWELDAQEKADLCVYYFDPETQSPITLLEVGLFKDKNVVVCCPEGFWRKGNIDITCQRYDVPMVKSLTDLILYIKRFVK